MKEKYIYIENGNTITRIALSDVIYIEKHGRQAVVTTENEELIWCRTMEQLKEAVDERFICCHRSYVINMDKIEKMEDQTIWLEGGFKVFYGRESFRKALRAFRDYISLEKSNKNDD